MPPEIKKMNNQFSFSTNNGSHLLRSQVYEYLREELKKENMRPGMFVSTNELANELNVSRTPLRDALLQLQAEGFVTFLPQRGIQINELSLTEVTDIYEMLGALDSTILNRVFNQIGPTEIRKMKRINDQMKKRINDKTYFKYFELNSNFHGVYLNLSQNHILLKQINILRQRLFDFGSAGDWVEKIRTLNYEEHFVLLEHIESGNARNASEYMRDVHCALNW